MKKEKITSPEKLNDYLKATSPITWIALGLVFLALLGLFIWLVVAKIDLRIEGSLTVDNNKIVLNLNDDSLKDITVGQTIMVDNLEGQIVEIKEDGTIIISGIDLQDGIYNCIILKEIRPINFF